MVHSSQHFSISIDAPVDKVYAFASNPENLPRWAAGLSSTITREGEDWIADSPLGKVKVKFARPNDFGILDHEVTLPDGTKVNNPMRVTPNGEGSEVIFTVLQLPGMSNEQFSEDGKMVAKDLKTLKGLLEK